MPTLNEQANAVLQEFGGVIPETFLSFEDAAREFVYVRALELQKIGIAATNKTVTISEMIVENRDGVMIMPSGVGALIPGAVEYRTTDDVSRYQVTIVDVDDIPAHEGNRAIAFYGEPMRYRLAFDSWLTGRLFVYYDPIEDLRTISGESEISFPLAFWTLLTKKAAFNVVDLITTKMAFVGRPEEEDRTKLILGALAGLKGKLAMQVNEWEIEMRKWVNRDLQQRPRLRRSNTEILGRGYDDNSDHRFDLFE